AACGGNGDHARHAGQDHEGHAHQEPGAVADMIPDRAPDHPLDEPAAGLFDAVLDDYLALSYVLVESDASAASDAAGQLAASADQFSQADLADPAREHAAGWLDVLQARIREIENSDDVEEQRKSYHELSETMIAMVDAFGHQKDQLYHQRCPMVNGGNGDWLSTQEQIMNPYHGDRMLHCGTTVRIL
ncbi:MAG: DUF3347 domain-containing protein, partial [Balneolaceae bacterium]